MRDIPLKRKAEEEIRTWPLNIFLIRQDLRDADKILSDINGLKCIPVFLADPPEEPVVANLYYATRVSDRPKWASFFGDLLEDAKLPKVSSAPAVLIVPVDERLMAVAFSYGSALLEPGCFDPTFGLRTALNSIKPGRVRSFDKRTFDALFRQTREQAARETKLEDFGIDAERDLVKTVSGKPENKLLGSSMAGSRSLHVSMKVTPLMLVPTLRRLFYRSKLDTGNKEYPWLGRIEEVLDRELTKSLDSYLDDRIKEGADGVWLAVPEIVDQAEVSEFRFVVRSKTKGVYPELNLENLCRALKGGIEDLNVDFLREHRVEMVDDNDTVLKKWRLYDCLNAEFTIGRENYILSSSAWYLVDTDLVKEVDREIDSLKTASLPLPPYQDSSEYAYNCRVAALWPERLCCLDDEKIMFGGGKSRFELCDLLESTGALIHVKRYGGSSVLSHLFAQGLVSADLLVKRPGFRENADYLVKSRGFTVADGKNFGGKAMRDVVYVIIGAPSGTARHQLPLFSRVNLCKAARGIRAFGWDVRLQYVDETELQKTIWRARRKKGSASRRRK